MPLNQVNTHIENSTLQPDSDQKDFDTIYIDNFNALHRYAFTLLNDQELAEEMVHLVFLKILERKEPINIHTSFKAYLYRAVNNECLNYIKHQKVEQNYYNKQQHMTSQQTETSSSNMELKQLEQLLCKAINELPEQCRTIFQLSRFEELKYAEIAAHLNLSVKTVEHQMSKALKRLRVQLADYLPLFIYVLLKSII